LNDVRNLTLNKSEESTIMQNGSTHIGSHNRKRQVNLYEKIEGHIEIPCTQRQKNYKVGWKRSFYRDFVEDLAITLAPLYAKRKTITTIALTLF